MEGLSKKIIQLYPEYSHRFTKDKTSLAKELNMIYKQECIGGIINPGGKDIIYHDSIHYDLGDKILSIFTFDSDRWSMSSSITAPKEFANVEDLKNGKISDKLYEFIGNIREREFPEIIIYHYDIFGGLSGTNTISKSKIF